MLLNLVEAGEKTWDHASAQTAQHCKELINCCGQAVQGAVTHLFREVSTESFGLATPLSVSCNL